MPDKLKVAIIGHTGRGNYGHGFDTCWRAMEEVRIVGVADPNDSGRAAAKKRLNAPAAFADYRRLLDETRPSGVGVNALFESFPNLFGINRGVGTGLPFDD